MQLSSAYLPYSLRKRNRLETGSQVSTCREQAPSWWELFQGRERHLGREDGVVAMLGTRFLVVQWPRSRGLSARSGLLKPVPHVSVPVYVLSNEPVSRGTVIGSSK